MSCGNRQESICPQVRVEVPQVKRLRSRGPVQAPTKFELTINLKAAKALDPDAALDVVDGARSGDESP
jgi:hypothetical protein